MIPFPKYIFFFSDDSLELTRQREREGKKQFLSLSYSHFETGLLAKIQCSSQPRKSRTPCCVAYSFWASCFPFAQFYGLPYLALQMQAPHQGTASFLPRSFKIILQNLRSICQQPPREQESYRKLLQLYMQLPVDCSQDTYLE